MVKLKYILRKMLFLVIVVLFVNLILNPSGWWLIRLIGACLLNTVNEVSIMHNP